GNFFARRRRLRHCPAIDTLLEAWRRSHGRISFRLGDRQELERRFQRLETIKAPQKVIIYSCVKWQEAVLEQLQAALLRYPHHITGEQYLALNVLGTEKRLAAHCITIPRDGILNQSDLGLMRPLAGSPFKWGAIMNATQSVADSDGA